MSEKMIKKIRFHDIEDSCIEFLDRGGILHVTDYPTAENFLKLFCRQSYLSAQVSLEHWENIFVNREICNFMTLAATTQVLKRLVHNHVFAMAVLPLIERIGCSIKTTHIDCGVIRYQLTNGLREEAEDSGYFKNEDFVRTNPLGIPEIFGYNKLPPHRDIRWPHIRILGGWMPLTNLNDGETLTLFPEVFSQAEALTDPSVTPYPTVDRATEFGLGKPFSPAMRAGEILLFHAATVHSSPVRQSATFRGSVDFRVAYPCIDDFTHYKQTFIQARNLIHLRDRVGTTNMALQTKALDSLTKELFDNCGSKHSVHEIRLSYGKTGRHFTLWTTLHIVINHFCPDTYLKIFEQTERTGKLILLMAILLRSNSYFWLYKTYLLAKDNGFFCLANFLKVRTKRASANTKLPIVSFPVKWPTQPRELMPEEVLQRLKN